MNLLKAVERFTIDTVTDPYGVENPIKGRLIVFNDDVRPGPNFRRRVLETLPSYAMFSSNCLTHKGKNYIAGSPNSDHYKGQALRVKYPVIPCDNVYNLGTVRQILTDTVPTRAIYASLNPTRNMVADAQTSYAVTSLTALLQQHEQIFKSQILFTGTTYYRVKSDAVIDGNGFKSVEVVLLSAPYQLMTFTVNSGYDVASDTVVNGASYSNTRVFVEDAYYSYDHTSERFSQIKPGDKNITFVPQVPPKASDLIGGYKILSIDLLSDGSYSCHCRR